MSSLPPLGLYIHLPWCVKKCPYCDFNSHERSRLPEQEYVAALLRDLDTEVADAAGRPISSIFFGGGTPSLFSPEAIHAILDGAQARIPFADDIEITLEANPGTVEAGKFEGFYQAGVNRLSIGVQSFQEDMLPRLGRIHGRTEAIAAAEMAHKAGFAEAKGFNLDLMFGLPTQSIDQAIADIETAMSLSPTHLSHYQLTLEPGTAFFYRPPALPKDDDIWQMQLRCQAAMAENGFAQYEVSAYAQAGKQCQHNLNYWRYGDYIGIGAGAHGKVTHLNAAGKPIITRRSKVKTPDKYLRYAGEAEAIDQGFEVEDADLGFEFMMNALRLKQGFGEHLFQERTGVSLTTLTALDGLKNKGLITTDQQRIATTDLGWRYLNEVVEAFL